MSAVMLACFAGLCLGALSVGTRLALRRAPSVLAGAFVMNLGAFCVVSLVALASGVSASDFDLDALWPFLVIGAVVPGTTQMLYVQAVRDAGASRTQVIMATAPLVAAVLAVTLLSESWSFLLLLGTLLIVSGGIALAWDKRRPVGFRALGVLVAAVVAVLSGGRDAATRWILSETDVSAFVEAATALLAASVMVLVWAAIRVRRPPDLRALGSAILPFGPVAILMGASYAAFFEAFDRGDVTLVAPLVGTHALWAVTLSVPFLGRSEAIGRRLAAAAVLVVVGATIVTLGRDESSEVTVEKALVALESDLPSTEISSVGPARGVYVYRTEGSEKVDALLSPSHRYPSQSFVGVAGSACGYVERWTPLEGRTTERELCPLSGGLAITHYSEVHTFLGSTDARDYVCSDEAIVLPIDWAGAATWSFSCDTGTTEETWTGRVVGVETGPENIEGTVVHLRFDTVLKGANAGTSVKEFWMRESDGLVIRERVVNENTTDTPIGAVKYSERYSLKLVSDNPER